MDFSGCDAPSHRRAATKGSLGNNPRCRCLCVFTVIKALRLACRELNLRSKINTDSLETTGWLLENNKEERKLKDLEVRVDEGEAQIQNQTGDNYISGVMTDSVHRTGKNEEEAGWSATTGHDLTADPARSIWASCSKCLLTQTCISSCTHFPKIMIDPCVGENPPCPGMTAWMLPDGHV